DLARRVREPLWRLGIPHERVEVLGDGLQQLDDAFHLAHDALASGASSSATTCSTLRFSASQMARMLSSPIGARLAPSALVRVRGAMPVSPASSRRLLPASAIAALTIGPLIR